MKRLVKTTAVTLAITALSASAAFASGWQKNSKGWWYGTNADNSSWHANGWQWVDGNGDGTAECYYFDANGYCLMNTTTPDGYKVDANGAWLVNGAVQTKKTGAAVQNQQSAASQAYTDDYSGTYVYDYSTDGVNYHDVMVLTYNKAENSILYNSTWTGSDGSNGNYSGKFVYSGPTAYNGHIMFELVSDEDKDAITFAAPGVLDCGDTTIQRQ